MDEAIAVIGLGYVGLPLAQSLAQKYKRVIGFDLDATKVEIIRRDLNQPQTLDLDTATPSTLQVTHQPEDLSGITFFIVAVPTPIDENHCPNLQSLIRASHLIGQVLQPGAVIVYESTVYPGVTEEICGSILADISGLQSGFDFKLGYSPERINPGDAEHTLEKIVKVVAGEDEPTLERIAAMYESIIEAGVYRAPSIRVAEAAKVIENVQRDLNIALMNELAIIFDRLNIRTKDVLQAASTKWNFMPFKPGLVGGHCIGVDPYYLANKAQQAGYYPEVILAGRRINNSMGGYLGQRLVQLLSSHQEIPLKDTKVGILGITFKENVSDIRNSRIPEIADCLHRFGIFPLVHDAMADRDEVQREYGIKLCDWSQLSKLNALILAVAHPTYLEMPLQKLVNLLQPGGVLMDVKSVIEPALLPPDIVYWSL